MEQNNSETTSENKEDGSTLFITHGRYGVLKFCCNVLSCSMENLPAERLHMAYKTVQAETKLVSMLLNSHGLREVSGDATDFNLLWTGLHVKPQVLRNLLPHQRVNHFPRSYELTRKDRLYKNIEQMQYTRGVKHFDFIPQTFILPMEVSELQTSHYRHRGAWIVKPVASSRGRGIYIVNSVDNIPLQESLVVAKYIENPLLVNGCKCDLRLYVLVTSYNPLLVYLYEEGLVRFAAVKYDNKSNNLWNPCMHLCNYSINKYHSDYIRSSDPEADDIGHKWTLSALLKYLRSENHDVASLMNRIEDLIIKSILATAPSIVTACRFFVPSVQNCFELYGFDILIDTNLKPWLLEVNLSPSLGCDTVLDTRLKSAMLADLLTLVGIPAVDPIMKPKTSIHKRTSLTRRTHSEDSLRDGCKSGEKISNVRLMNRITSEDLKLLRIVQEQFDRRGGFLRIFPNADSWKKYSVYLDTSTGIPSFGLPQIISSNSGSSQNYNKMIHTQLFPNMFLPQRVSSAVNICPLQSVSRTDRLKRYERSLDKGHRTVLENRLFNEDPADDVEFTKKSSLIKQEVIKYLKNGCQLSSYQEKCLFGQYLNGVLRQLNNCGHFKLKENTKCDNVLRFLEKMSQIFTNQFQFKMPSHHLKSSDKVAVTAKHLSDFIAIYGKDIARSKLNVESSSSAIPERIFCYFLQISKKNDIEEILNLNAKLHNSSSVAGSSKLKKFAVSTHVFQR